MRAKLGLAVLLASVLFWAPGGPAAQLAGQRLAPLEEPLLQPASVTVPEAPVAVDTAAAANSRGWTGSLATDTSQDLTGDVLAAYTLAVAVSPLGCHLTTPMLAAIGQVESGNLAGRTLDGHRVSPEILGPVLDGDPYRAVADTDAGRWDHHQVWDRALGPMQIIPSTWRVVGLDMDGDGVRDPQNIYDSAGAAMAYLCAGGRDLATSDGLQDAILSYNDSEDYLRAVLAWKAVFDQADLSGMGAVPFVAALAMPSTAPPALGPSPATRTHAPTASATPSPLDPASPAATPAPAAPSPSGAPSTPPTASPGTPSPSAPTAPATGSPGPPVDGPPAAPSEQPASEPPTDPTPPPAEPSQPAPDPTPPPALPECPVPTPEETAAPETEPAADAPVVSPETCTPPEGYVFDPETGELVPVPAASPAP
jgi:hypothetical protein